MAVKKADLDNVFSDHVPEQADLDAYEAIRTKGKELAELILEKTPVCGDQQAAIRKVREAVFTANSAVALKGAV
jgi:hypothetical protein